MLFLLLTIGPAFLFACGNILEKSGVSTVGKRTGGTSRPWEFFKGILGDSEEYFVPGDTITGQFDAGIAEALGLAGEVCDSTKVLLEAVKTALNGTIANPEFQDRFKTLLVKAENLEDRLTSLVVTTDPQLKKSLANLNKVTVKVNELVDGVKEPINGLFAGTDKVMGNANQLISELEGVTKHLDGLIAKVQAKMDSKDNTVGILLN